MTGKQKSMEGQMEEAQAKESVVVPPTDEQEKTSCNPIPVNKDKFNSAAILPYGCTNEHIHQAMNEFLAFLGFLNTQLNSKGIQRLECMLMPANFSGMVREIFNLDDSEILRNARQESVSQWPSRSAPEGNVRR